MPDESALARGWFLKADSDLSAARCLLEGEGPFDTSCFHAQQAVEKLLKALLASRGREIPRTHNVEDLQHLCMRMEPSLTLGELDLADLTSFAVEMRYDFDFWPDRATAAQALDLAESVRTIVLSAVPPAARP